jgi:MFS family permease
MSEARRALIVANADYQDRSFRGLVSPAHDAEQLARVLRDPSVGGFEVATLLNEKAAVVNQAIEEFFIFSEPGPNDLLLFYFSGHGITDDEGHLYLATTDMQLVHQTVRRANAVSAEFVDSTMRRSRCRRQVLVLDCCHSGAFAEGMRMKGEQLPAIETHFKGIQGKGRIVLTASTARQFSFEGSTERGGEPSVYTRILVKGLETGEADIHGDGQVDLDELHEYLLEQLHTVAPNQTPTKSGYMEGRLYIARSRSIRPTELPQKLREALNAPEAWLRQGAINELEMLLRADHRGLALGAEQALVHLRDNDDSLKVRAAAGTCLTAFQASASGPNAAVGQRPAREQAEEAKSTAQERAAREQAELAKREKEGSGREQSEPRRSAALQTTDVKMPPPKSVFVALLAIAALDRAVRFGLSGTAPGMLRELKISSMTIGSSITAFTFSYAVCAVLAGFAVDRFGTRRVFTVGLLVSTVAVAWTAAASDVASLFASRALLGCGLSPLVPVFCAIFARYDERGRAMANALFGFVAQTAAFTAPALYYGLTADNWRSSLGITAVLGAAMAAIWMAVDRSAGPLHSPMGQMGQTLRSRTAIGCFAAYFGYSYCITEFTNSLRVVGLSGSSFSWISTGPVIAIGVSALLVGVFLARQISSSRETAVSICKRFLIFGLAVAALSLAVTSLSKGLSTYILAIGCCLGLGAVWTSVWTLLQTAAPTGATAKWGGIQSVFGTTGGVIASSLTGVLVDSFGIIPGFLLADIVVIGAVVAAALLIDSKPTARAFAARSVQG